MGKVLLKYKGSPADAEIRLEKAVESIKLDREQKVLPEPYLKDKKDTMDSYVAKIFENMIEEIAKVVVPNESNRRN